jgi:hypothetical protein
MELFMTPNTRVYRKYFDHGTVLLQAVRSHRAYRMALKSSKGACIPALCVDLIAVLSALFEFNHLTRIRCICRISFELTRVTQIRSPGDPRQDSLGKIQYDRQVRQQHDSMSGSMHERTGVQFPREALHQKAYGASGDEF